MMNIEIVKEKISMEKLQELAKDSYGHMIKGVVDVHLKIIALGGELHADAEAVLLQRGSDQQHLWGFNIYPQKSSEERIEYTSFINIRPRQNNRSLEIKNRDLRAKIRSIVDDLIEGTHG
jgi:hypothetical protein